MRSYLIFLLSVHVVLAAETALGDCGCGFPHHRRQPCQQCKDKYAPMEKQMERENVPAQPEGAFAAPPRTGAVAGETRAIGLEGMAVEFPAFRISMPSIRLPALTRYRTGPRMLVNESVAPFVQDFREEASFERTPIQQQQERTPAIPESGPLQRSAEFDHLPPKPPACTQLPVAPSNGIDWMVSNELAAVGRDVPEYDERMARLERMEASLQRQMEVMAQLVRRLEGEMNRGHQAADETPVTPVVVPAMTTPVPASNRRHVDDAYEATRSAGFQQDSPQSNFDPVNTNAQPYVRLAERVTVER